MKKKPKPAWFVYMLLCAGDRIYTGVSTDPEARFEKHCSGRGAKFTRANKPVRLLAARKCRSRSAALKLEYALKQLPRAGKVGWVERILGTFPRARDQDRRDAPELVQHVLRDRPVGRDRGRGVLRRPRSPR